MSGSDTESNKRAHSAANKSYTARGEDKVAYPTRLRRSTYEALMAASTEVSTSGNSLVDEAIVHYLASESFAQKQRSRVNAEAEVIRKLSGR